MRPADVTLLPSLSAPAVHPSGAWAVVAASYPNTDADAYVGQLWRVDLTGGEPPRRITRGQSDGAPRFSPDGRLLAFLRPDADGRAQVWVAPAAGGEAVRATDAKLGVGEFAFAPDGSSIAYLARVPEEGRYGSTEGVAASAEDPRRIATLQFQYNGIGWTNDRRRHVFVVPTPDPGGEPYVAPKGRAKAAREALGADERKALPGEVAEAIRLTSGDADHGELSYAPDGTILVTSARHASRDTDLVTEVFRVDPRTPDAEPVPVAPGQNAYGAAHGASGILFLAGEDLGASGRDFVGKLGGVYAVRDGEPVRLTDPESIQVVGSLRPHGDGVVTVADDRGTARALTVDAAGAVALWPGEASVLSAVELPGDPGRLVVAVAAPEFPAELGILSADGGLEILTDFSGRLRAAAPAVVGRELTATASDGYPVHGWAYVPDGDGPHPVLLCIHGGPHSSYGPAFFDEFQTYARAGYAVVACNPRGSSGYGLHHGRVIKDDMGNLDASDILAFLDHALASVDGLDAARVGVMGGSYGGYMTAWLIGHTDRFAAAIVERGFLDTESFIGASDIGWFFVEEYNGSSAEHRLTQSPQAFADRVSTPTLVVHSEDDLRCPLGPALRYYTTLKLNGVDAELLVFPGENHELSRSGTPHHRIARFEAILGWWAKHLPVGGAS